MGSAFEIDSVAALSHRDTCCYMTLSVVQSNKVYLEFLMMSYFHTISTSLTKGTSACSLVHFKSFS